MNDPIRREDGWPAVTLLLTVGGSASGLAETLAAVAGHVDEIVAVDAGADAPALAALQQAGARVVASVAAGDAAACRQQAFALARGAWVVWLEPGERLEGADLLRETLAEVGADIARLRCRLNAVATEDARPVAYGWGTRAVRTAPGVRWRGAVEPALDDASIGAGATYAQHLRITRRVAAGEEQARARAALPALIREVAAAGDAPDPRRLHAAAQAHLLAGDPAGAAAALARALPLAADDDLRCLLALDLGAVRERLGDDAGAGDAFAQAAAARPEWALPWFALARVAYRARQWERVVRLTEIGRAQADPDPDEAMIAVGPLRHDWLIAYTNALWWVGRVADALWWTEYALGNDPDDAYHRANLTLFRQGVAAERDRWRMSAPRK